MSSPENKDQFVPASPDTGAPVNSTPTSTGNPAQSTSGMAVAGLVCAFLFPLLGLIFSIIGLGQTKDGKRGGRGLALAGLILSILFMLSGIIIWVLILVAAANTETPDYTYNGSNSSLTSGEEAKIVSGSLSEAVEVDNMELTASNLVRGFTPKSEFYEPSAGKEFISVNVALKNTGTESESFSSFDFKVRDSAGVEQNDAYVGEVDGQLESGSLAGGGSVSGVIVFEVPTGDTGLVLVYKPSYFSNEVAEIKL